MPAAPPTLQAEAYRRAQVALAHDLRAAEARAAAEAAASADASRRADELSHELEEARAALADAEERVAAAAAGLQGGAGDTSWGEEEEERGGGAGALEAGDVAPSSGHPRRGPDSSTAPAGTSTSGAQGDDGGGPPAAVPPGVAPATGLRQQQHGRGGKRLRHAAVPSATAGAARRWAATADEAAAEEEAAYLRVGEGQGPDRVDPRFHVRAHVFVGVHVSGPQARSFMPVLLLLPPCRPRRTARGCASACPLIHHPPNLPLLPLRACMQAELAVLRRQLSQSQAAQAAAEGRAQDAVAQLRLLDVGYREQLAELEQQMTRLRLARWGDDLTQQRPRAGADGGGAGP